MTPLASTHSPINTTPQWREASKFRTLVQDAHAFYISGLQGAGKAATARNILGAKRLEGQSFHVRRYDPRANQRQDYWRIAPTWSSSEQAVEMALFILGLVSTRQREIRAQPNARFEWIYFVLEELEHTLTTRMPYQIGQGDRDVSEAQVILEAIAAVVTAGSALKIGLLLCAQTPNLDAVVGSEIAQQPQFISSLCQIAIGAHGLNYLATHTDTTGDREIAANYQAIYNWCNQKNEGITDQARQYRLALLIRNAERKIIELPKFGELGFDKLTPTTPYDFRQADVCTVQRPLPAPNTSRTRVWLIPPPSQPAQRHGWRRWRAELSGAAMLTGLIGIIGAGIAGAIAASADLKNFTSEIALVSTMLCSLGIVGAISLSTHTHPEH